MSIKTRLNYSTNFYLRKRKKKEIKFLIFHYTGMKSEKLAIKKLTEIQSELVFTILLKKMAKLF